MKSLELHLFCSVPNWVLLLLIITISLNGTTMAQEYSVRKLTNSATEYHVIDINLNGITDSLLVTMANPVKFDAGENDHFTLEMVDQIKSIQAIGISWETRNLQLEALTEIDYPEELIIGNSHFYKTRVQMGYTNGYPTFGIYYLPEETVQSNKLKTSFPSPIFGEKIVVESLLLFLSTCTVKICVEWCGKDKKRCCEYDCKK